MAHSFLGQKRLRRYYGRIREVLEMPNLIEVQKSSYDLFLDSGDGETPQDGEGLMGVFQSVFPIRISTRPASWNSSATSSSARNTMSTSASSAT